MFTDAGPFSFKTAKASGKDHCLCTQHERTSIPAATAGLDSDQQHAMSDINPLIFKCTSIDELDEKFEQFKLKYGCNAPSLKYLESLQKNKELLCRAHTQACFSYNHTTTQTGEGYNDRLKGHGTLKSALSDASLPTLIDRIDAIALDTNHKSIDTLAKVRINNERVTPAYKEEVSQSLQLSALTVTSCEKVDGSESKFIITRSTGHQFNVDLKEKIMHRGVIFVIPTCDCGYYLSCFRLCRDIVTALVDVSSSQVSLEDLLVPQNIHPFHLVQLHPLWPQALRKTNREDYSDLEAIGQVLGCGVVASSQQSTSNVASSHGAPCPEKFYVYSKGNKKAPSTHKARFTKLSEQSKKVQELAVNKGDEQTFDHCYARLLQVEKELRDMIKERTGGILSIEDNIPLPPQHRASNRAERRKADGTNNSRLSASSSANAGVGKKKSTKKSTQTNKNTPICSQCVMMKEHMNFPLSTDHLIGACPHDDLFTKHFLKSGTADIKGETKAI